MLLGIIYTQNMRSLNILKHNFDQFKLQNKAVKSFLCHISPRARALGLQKVKIEEKHKKQKKRRSIYISMVVI